MTRPSIVPAATLYDELESLVPVALRGLLRMQDSQTGLFSHKATTGLDGHLQNHGINPLYSGAAVVGLLSHPEGRAGRHAGPAARALEALLDPADERDPAILGTTLWGSVLAGRAEASRVAARLIEVTEPGRASSMQLGLALSGLAQWLRIGGGPSRRIAGAAGELAAELQRRFRPQADVFAATRRHGPDPGLARMTSFASQVYPVLGLCELARATDTAPPPQVTTVCDFLVRCQGRLGQWWWFYSTRAPKVVEGYPVYSVHQDAMAFMAMLSVTRLTGVDYRPALMKGLRWVTGENELGRSLVDHEAGVILRAIQRPGGDADGLVGWSRRQRLAATMAAVANRGRAAPGAVEQLPECRSYHLGWLLLAAAMARSAG